MSRLSPRFTRLSTSLALAATVALGSVVPSFAAGETGVTISGATDLTGGNITYANFTGITLNGTQQTTTATWSTSNISDARGTGAGWNLSLNLTQFKQHDGTAYVVSGKSLAASSMKVTTAPVVSQVDSTSSPASTVTPVAATTALDTASAVKLLSAAVNGGMGSYSFSNMTSTLTVPANAYAATYKADATVSLNSTP